MAEPKPRPTMFVLAGPNGAGKSTFYETVIRPKINAPFINADIIQKDEMGDLSLKASYQAAKIAAERRQFYIDDSKSFVTESTFSHPSKLQLIQDAKTAGFRIILFHVNVRHPDLSVARVAARVQEGGHDVPEEKIRERYMRSQSLIKQAALISDRAFIYDNSGLNQPPSLLISFNCGRVEKVAESIPTWAKAIYQEELVYFYKKR